MALQLGVARVFFAIFFLLVSLAGVHNAKTFNVRNYGAVADGRTDNRKVSTNVGLICNVHFYVFFLSFFSFTFFFE